MNLKKTIVIAVAVGIAGVGFVLLTLLTSVIFGGPRETKKADRSMRMMFRRPWRADAEG